MINVKIPIHPRNLNARIEAMKSWQIPAEEKRDLLLFLNDLSLGKVNQGKRISEVRQLKYLDLLRIPLLYFNKVSSRLTVKDVEAFEKDLGSDRILGTKKNCPFAPSTKADIRKLLQIYLKWQIGDTDRYRKLCGWLDTRQVAKTPDYLAEAEVEQLYKHCKSADERFLVAVLFDAGARAEEFHNIRLEDVQLPTANENYVRLTLKEEYSKTKGRTICLYWKYSVDAAREFLKERMLDGIKTGDPVYNKNYENTRKILNRLGIKVLKRSLHYHLFRHSSATYYATKLNRQQLCYRYGWRFSSDMPDVYISRSGMESKELDDKFTSTTIDELRLRLERQEQELLILKDANALAETKADIRQSVDPVIDQLIADPKVRELLQQYKRQQGQRRALR